MQLLFGDFCRHACSFNFDWFPVFWGHTYPSQWIQMKFAQVSAIEGRCPRHRIAMPAPCAFHHRHLFSPQQQNPKSGFHIYNVKAQFVRIRYMGKIIAVCQWKTDTSYKKKRPENRLLHEVQTFPISKIGIYKIRLFVTLLIESPIWIA
jgi:hypothetical protein